MNQNIYSSSIKLGIPNLVAYHHKEHKQLYIWCKYGKKYHLHGEALDGLRSSHCGVCKQKYGKGYSSYNLVYVGEMPEILKKDLNQKKPKGPIHFGYPEEFIIEEKNYYEEDIEKN